MGKFRRLLVLALIQSLALVIGHPGARATPSARRAPNETWTDLVKRHRPTAAPSGFFGLTSSSSPQSKSTLAKSVDFLSEIQKLNLGMMSKDQMNHIFLQGRDTRFLFWSSKPELSRRSTWLYPDDGCYARAALLARNSETWMNVLPAKIYVFGNLTVTTKNSTYGTVNWWYHVAPLVTDGTDVYVLDPAINPSGPLLVKDWLATMSTTPDNLMVSVCHGYSYGPFSTCENPDPTEDQKAVQEQSRFLDMEWERLVDLGRDPQKELGSEPPWLAPAAPMSTAPSTPSAQPETPQRTSPEEPHQIPLEPAA